MEWFSQYVIEPSGVILWREGARVTNPELFDAFERQPLVGHLVCTFAAGGVLVGEA